MVFVAKLAFAVVILLLHLLIEIESLVHHLLLAPHQIAELVHLLLHLIGLPLTLALLARLPRLALLQIIHHILQLRQKLFRLIARSLTCQIFNLIHHALQIFFGQHTCIWIERRIASIGILLLTLGKFTQEILHCLA